jgi:hypothetical protein
MKKLVSLLLLMSILPFSGCLLLVAGGAATGGYALSTDSAEGIVDDQYETVWDAAVEVFEDEGIIKIEDEKHGRIEADVQGINMKMQLNSIGKDSAQMKISARKNLMPKAKQAEEVFVKILQKVK